MSLIPFAGAVQKFNRDRGYKIERSLRFNSADSTYLNRTPASAGNRKTFTISFWAKRAKIGGATPYYVFQAGSGTAEGTWFAIAFDIDILVASTWTTSGGQTTAVYRDVSAWYHIVIAIDTTQATAANRSKIYVNNVQQATNTVTLTQNADLAWNNASVVHYIGGRVDSGPRHFYDGYLTEIYNIDGQALDPTSFGEYNTDTGVWQPKAYSGSYGTNGFYLNFSDNSGTTSTTLGKDQAGSNNWTPNNFSVTAGAGNDSLVDTPTNYGTDTGVGGEVRGNYATLNPLSKSSTPTPSDGNLVIAFGGTYPANVLGSVGVSSGKWYWEVLFAGGSNANGHACGVAVGGWANRNLDPETQSSPFNHYVDSRQFFANNGVTTSNSTSFTAGDIIGVALNVDSNQVSFYKNGVLIGSAQSLEANQTWFPFHKNSSFTALTQTVNYGQRPWAHTPPSGFKALCTQNLPEPTIKDGGQYFNTVLYTGNGSTQSITGVGFQPDWVWIKNRSGANSHQLSDTLRGFTKYLFSDATLAEETRTNQITSVGADGFSLDSGAAVNNSGSSYVAWNWKANGAGVENTDGTITSTVSANPDSGFSIVTYASGAAGQKTVGHGLGVAPSMIITKSRTSASFNWSVYHASVTDTTSKFLRLNTTDAIVTFSTIWGAALPTSSVFGITSGGGVVENTDCIAYCFAAIPGYSAISSFTGNGSADGPFIFTNHRPAFVLIKRTDTTSNWTILDFQREGYNVDNDPLFPNLSNAEGTTDLADLLSNGFKLRTTDASVNASGGTYIYMSLASNPFKYSLGR